MGRFGDGAVYRDGDHISVSPSPSANLQKITDSALSPIREAAVTATAILALDSHEALHRYDGHTWSAISLEPGTVQTVMASGVDAVALTSQGHLFSSHDSGATWKVEPANKDIHFSLIHTLPGADADAPDVLVGIKKGGGEVTVDGAFHTKHEDDAFLGGKLRFPLPVGVTTIDGVDLTTSFAERNALSQKRYCDAYTFSPRGAAAFCSTASDNSGSLVVVATTDGGATVSELFRGASDLHGGMIAIADNRVIVVPDDESAILLKEQPGSWAKVDLDVPWIYPRWVLPDRRTRGGFYVVGGDQGTASLSHRQLVQQVLCHVDDQGVTTQFYLGSWPDTIANPVLAADVADDGAISLVQRRADGGLDIATFSLALEKRATRTVAVKPNNITVTGAALHGNLLILRSNDAEFFLTDDAGQTFRKYTPPIEASKSLAGTSMRCGWLGCDFEPDSINEPPIEGLRARWFWRWGDEGPKATQ